MSKYDPLSDFLLQIPLNISEKTLSFREIEKILGFTLPNSAYHHRPWWSNPSSAYDHPYAQAWLAVSWEVGRVDLDQLWVRFRRKTSSKKIELITVQKYVKPLTKAQGVSQKIVIQCAGSKYKNAGRLTTFSGENVLFAAHPELYDLEDKCFRPDDLKADTGSTWREYLELYNLKSSNPNNLLKAGELYKPPIYEALITAFCETNVYILSAGWGLVRSDYLLPYYDITFSNKGMPYSIRRTNDSFEDFNQLSSSNIEPDETIYFFGGQSYLPLYQKLTRTITTRKVIYHAHGAAIQIQGYECIPSPFRGNTNWHYVCAFGFINGTVPR
jgi:hypothetical protein